MLGLEKSQQFSFDKHSCLLKQYFHDWILLRSRLLALCAQQKRVAHGIWIPEDENVLLAMVLLLLTPASNFLFSSVLGDDRLWNNGTVIQAAALLTLLGTKQIVVTQVSSEEARKETSAGEHLRVRYSTR